MTFQNERAPNCYPHCGFDLLQWERRLRQSSGRRPADHINRAAFGYARELIAGGRVVADKKGSWRTHYPSRSEENEFIHNYGFAEYAKWHLGIESRHSSQSKAHYKFPFGDFAALHRCGLLAVKARAHQSGYAEI